MRSLENPGHFLNIVTVHPVSSLLLGQIPQSYHTGPAQLVYTVMDFKIYPAFSKYYTMEPGFKILCFQNKVLEDGNGQGATIVYSFLLRIFLCKQPFNKGFID